LSWGTGWWGWGWDWGWDWGFGFPGYGSTWWWPSYWGSDYGTSDGYAGIETYVDEQPQNQTWRETAPAPSGEPGDYATPSNGDGGGAPLGGEASEPNGASRGHIFLWTEPSDASVFLNGEFVGTGRELAALPGGLPVPPGQHTITISRTGMATEEHTVIVGPGRKAIVEISLKPS
jgi:hypothetical protein